MLRTSANRIIPDRVIVGAVFCICLFNFSYFFQGDNWGSMSVWASVRSIVERGTMEISPFADRTGDVAIHNAEIYSNKPPGLALLGCGPYWLTRKIELASGYLPDSKNVEWLNFRLCAIELSGLPAAILIAAFYLWLRRELFDQRTAAMLAMLLAFGSDIWPYTGQIFNHNLVALCVLAAWILISSPRPTDSLALAASALLGLALICEYMAAPIILIFIIYEFYKRRDLKRVALLCVGPAGATIGLMYFQYALFGNIFTPSYLYEPQLEHQGARFSLPDFRRLYWITFHKTRGLFYISPAFILSLGALGNILKKPRAEETVYVAIIGFFTLLLMTYKFWTGGWGVGLRFAIPGFAFMLIFAKTAIQKFPRLSMNVIVFSIISILIITSVQAQFRSLESGPPDGGNPLISDSFDFIAGTVARREHSTNLGLQMSLSGSYSVIPVAMIIATALLLASRLPGPTHDLTAQRARESFSPPAEFDRPIGDIDPPTDAVHRSQ